MKHNKNKNKKAEVSPKEESSLVDVSSDVSTVESFPEEKSPLQNLAEVSSEEVHVETVVLYDVNEHPVTVAVDEVEGYVARGYRKVLLKK